MEPEKPPKPPREKRLPAAAWPPLKPDQEAAAQALPRGDSHKSRSSLTDVENGNGYHKLQDPVESKQEKQQTVRRLHCCAIFSSRLLCSWALKLAILCGFVNGAFLVGRLSKPFWIPISMSRACQTNSDRSKPKAWGFSRAKTLEDCKNYCESFSYCQAVDYFNTTGWCSLYSEACESPTASWDGASSWQVAISCQLHNGTTGVFFGGRCNVAMKLPSPSSVIVDEVPRLLTSPRSWGCSLAVTVIYAYAVSPWFREYARPVGKPVTDVTWHVWRRLTGQGCLGVLVLVAAWTLFTYYQFGPVKVWNSKDTFATPKLPIMEWVWLAASAFIFVVIVCKPLRGLLLSLLLALGTMFMTCFGSLSAFFLSACFDMATVGAATGAAGLGALGAGAAADGAILAETAVLAEGAAALEAGVAADAIVGTEGILTADAALAGTAAAEAAVAAEAALAAEMAMAAEAALAVETVGPLAFLCVVQ